MLLLLAVRLRVRVRGWRLLSKAQSGDVGMCEKRQVAAAFAPGPGTERVRGLPQVGTCDTPAPTLTYCFGSHHRFVPREAVWFEHSDVEHKTIIISSQTDLANRLLRDASVVGHMRTYLEVGPSRWGRLRGKEFGAAGMMNYAQFEMLHPGPTHVSQTWIGDSKVATDPVGNDGVLKGTFKGTTTPSVKVGTPFVHVPFAGAFQARHIAPPLDPLLRGTIEGLATGWRRR